MESVTTVGKKELALRLAANTYGLTPEAAEAAIKAMLEQIAAAVSAGEKVVLTGFGTFDARERSARTARNPRTGEEIPVEAKMAPGFKAAVAFKQRVADELKVEA